MSTLPSPQAIRPAALQIGAGNIGRALLGEIFFEAGLQLTFADVNEALVTALHHDKTYQINIVSAAGSETKTIRDVDAISMLDEAALHEHILHASIITTAVGVAVLPKIAPALARGLAARLSHATPTKHATIIACENVAGNTTILRDHVLAQLPDDTTRRQVLAAFSFPNCAVDRIVPNLAKSNSDSLTVTTEAYYLVAVDRTALHETPPPVAGFTYVDDIEAVLTQKLFTFNGLHAAAAYLGYREGCATIDQAVSRHDVAPQLAGFLEEVSAVLVSRYPSIALSDQQNFAQKTLTRIQNPYLHDTPARVGREPLRKLGQHDRLVQPALLAPEAGVKPTYITRAIAAGFCFDSPTDPQAIEIQNGIRTEGARATIARVTGLDENHWLVNDIETAYRHLV